MTIILFRLNHLHMVIDTIKPFYYQAFCLFKHSIKSLTVHYANEAFKLEILPPYLSASGEWAGANEIQFSATDENNAGFV